MSVLRVSIAGLMTLVLFLAVTLETMKDDFSPGSRAVFAVTSGTLATAFALGLTRTGGKRRFLWGFAVIGGLYWLEAFGPWDVIYQMPTGFVLWRIDGALHPQYQLDHRFRFLTVHSLFSLAFGIIGGLASRQCLASIRRIGGR
jgi:hypothetical protein